jgi:periplasmic protein TonB
MTAQDRTYKKIITQESNQRVEHAEAPCSGVAVAPTAGVSDRAIAWPRIMAVGRSMLSLSVVLGLHAVLLAGLIHYRPQPPHVLELPKPMMVALVTPPAPQPAVTLPALPPPEPIPPQPKPKLKPKKVVRPKPAPRPKAIQTPVEPPEPTSVPQPLAHAAPVQGPPTKSPSAEPMPPKFSANYLKNPAPDYPAISRRLGERGQVLLRVLVSPEGRPEQVEINRSSGYQRLDQAAQNAVRRWQFVPARQGENTVRAWVIVPIVFTLKG